MENNNKASFYPNPDPIFHDNTCQTIERLKIELNNKPYYTDAVLAMYLSENGLDTTSIYNKDTMQKKLLQTVYEILQSLSNNLDLFRSIETEFATTSQAYTHLDKRMLNLQKRIMAIPDAPNSDNSKGCISFMYHS